MILLLASNSRISEAFQAELQKRLEDFLSISCDDADLADIHATYELFRRLKPRLVINTCCATENLNRTLTESEKKEILYRNVLVPQTTAQVCRMRNIPWGKVSPGSIFQGAKVYKRGQWEIELDLRLPDIRRRIACGLASVRGFDETDEPNHCFACPPCDFYSGAAALGEQAIRNIGSGYIWRHGLLFDRNSNSFANGSKSIFIDRENGSARKIGSRQVMFSSMTATQDFPKACLDLWEMNAPFGVYHLVHQGIISFTGQGDSLGKDCLLDSSKIQALGVRMQSAEEMIGPLMAQGR